MRSRARSLLLVLVLTPAAALSPGAAVSSAAGPCLVVDLRDLNLPVAESAVIVIARVAAAEPEKSVTLAPEAYLKGAATAGEFETRFPDPRPRCPLATFAVGSRVVAFLTAGERGALEWPGALQVFRLEGGRAVAAGLDGNVATTEAELVAQVRGITGQYAIPAAANDDEAGIKWHSTVLPVAVALGVVFGIGLLLMRLWHRIDPS